jgi:flagellar biosynthesis component FlhA
MFHITSSLFGGLAAVTAWALVAPGFEQATKASLAADTHERVNRAVKADRIAAPRTSVDGTRAVVTVEVVGVRDAAIVYRDRDGRVLFQTDPVSNVTVISKGFVLPQVTVRETPQSTPAPIMVPHNIDAAPKMPVGCDPVASPIAEPALARVTGRCLS